MAFTFPDIQPYFLFRNAHLNTILPNRLRKVDVVNYTRKRLTTIDEDFIDIDYSKVGSNRLVVIFHGLEGSSERQYVKGMVRIFNDNGFDAVAANHRSCSGEMNLLPTSYHSGKTDDVSFVIDSVLDDYEEIYLIGFSLGGNMLLKYLGDGVHAIPEKIKRAVAISVPVHLKDSAVQLAKKSNWIYMKRFLNTLQEKAKWKIERFPELDITQDQINACKTFTDFDNLITAPIHGFKDAEDYWSRCSSKQFIKGISVPTILINALDDPFLGKSCYPFEEVSENKNIKFLAPKYGGHVGFAENFQFDKPLWTERMAFQFFTNGI